MKKIIYVVVALIVIAIIIAANSEKGNVDISQEAIDLDWSSVFATDIAQTSAEWGEPQRLSFNTGGWEEGAYISPNGDEFFFIYTNVDVFKYAFLNKLQASGPERDTTNQCTHPLSPTPHACGTWPRADLFYTQKLTDGWSEPIPHPLTKNYPVGGLVLAGLDKAYFMSGFDDDVEDIGFAERFNGVWGDKIRIASVSSDQYIDSDPHVTEDDNEMFFWSDRPARFKGKNIYRSYKVNGSWQAPELLPEPINTDGEDMQTFLFGNTLYYTTDRGGASNLSIYASTRLGINEWSEPKLVVSSAVAVGEPSLTKDGKKLYFEQIYTDGNGNFNPELLFVERK